MPREDAQPRGAQLVPCRRLSILGRAPVDLGRSVGRQAGARVGRAPTATRNQKSMQAERKGTSAQSLDTLAMERIARPLTSTICAVRTSHVHPSIRSRLAGCGGLGPQETSIILRGEGTDSRGSLTRSELKHSAAFSTAVRCPSSLCCRRLPSLGCFCDDVSQPSRDGAGMARRELKGRGSLRQPGKHTTADGTMGDMLDGFGFGLLPSAAAIMFPAAFPEGQQPPASGRARRRSGRHIDRALGYAVRRGRTWLNRSSSFR